MADHPSPIPHRPGRALSAGDSGAPTPQMVESEPFPPLRAFGRAAEHDYCEVVVRNDHVRVVNRYASGELASVFDWLRYPCGHWHAERE